MGRAAAAGTGLLANVVAGVGSAVGASRTGTAEGGCFTDVGLAGGGGGGSTGVRGACTSHGEAPLVQLYRRADDADEVAAPADGGSASAQMNRSSSSSCAVGGPGGCRSASAIDSSTGTKNGGGLAVSGQSVSSTEIDLPGKTLGCIDSTNSNAFTGDATADTWVGGDGTERRSALGMASATGGAMLRGLWGGVQSAAAAGAAVAAQVGAVAEERAAIDAGGRGGGDSEPAPEFRLYRRDGDN